MGMFMSMSAKSKINSLNKTIRFLNKKIRDCKDQLSKLQAQIKDTALNGGDVSGYESRYNVVFSELERLESSLRVSKDQLESYTEIYNASRGLVSEVSDILKEAFVSRIRGMYSRSSLSDVVDGSVRVARVVSGRNRQDRRIEQYSDSSFSDFTSSIGGQDSVRVSNVRREGIGSVGRVGSARSMDSVHVGNVVSGSGSSGSLVTDAGLSQSQARDLVQGVGDAVPSIDEGITGIYRILKKWWDRETRIKSDRGDDSDSGLGLLDFLGDRGLGGSKKGRFKGGFRKISSGLARGGARLAGGVAGLAFAGYDAFSGVKNAKNWLGDRALRPDGSVSTSAKVVSGISGFLGGNDSGVSGALSGAAKGAGIGMFFGPIGAAIGGAVGAGLGAIGGERIANFVMDAGDGIKSLTKKAVSTASDLWGETKDFAKNTWSSVKGVASSAVSSVKDVASSVWTNVKDSFSSFKDNLVSVFGSVGDKVSEIASGISGLKDKVVNSVTDFAGSVKDRAVDFASSVKDSVSNVVDSAKGVFVKSSDDTAQVSPKPTPVAVSQDTGSNGSYEVVSGDLRVVLSSLSESLLTLTSMLGGMNAIESAKGTVVLPAPVQANNGGSAPSPTVVPLNNNSADLQLSIIKSGY